MILRRPSRLPLALSGLILASSALIAHPAQAWGLKTHLWIAEKVLHNVRNGCRLELGLGSSYGYSVPQEACTAIRNHPAEFRAGVLGPDIFPDFIVGQVTTHPGTNAEGVALHDHAKWSTGKYLSRLLNAASTPEEIAFAWGYVVHAAGDVFAHTYVNNYAGDVFDLDDAERRVELRHFVLEKYIEARTPFPPGFKLDKDSVRVPADFVKKHLIWDAEVRQQHKLAKSATLHVALMHDLHKSNLPRPALSKEIVAQAKAVAAAAEKLLTLRRNELGAARSALRKARRGMEPPASALSAAKTRLAALGSAGTSTLLAKIQSELATQNDDLEPVVTTAPAGGELEEVRNRLKTVEDSDADNDSSLEMLKSAKQSLDQSLQQAQSAPGVSAHGAARTSGRVSLGEADSILRAATALEKSGALSDSASASLSVAQAELEEVKLAQIDIREQEVAALAVKEQDAEATQKQAKRTSVIADFKEKLRQVRLEGIERATAAYVGSSMATAIGIMNDVPDKMEAYKQWKSCWAMTYAGVPYQWMETKCRIGLSLDDLNSRIHEDFERMIQRLPAPIPKLAHQYAYVKAMLVQLLKQAAWKAAKQGVAAITDDDATVEFVHLVADPANATREKLIEVYNLPGKDNKKLLLLPDIADLVDKDLKTASGNANPEEFEALRHAVTLAKLSLMDFEGVNQMYRDHVGPDHASAFKDGAPLYPATAGRQSILPLMVKSIDGNHQWQPYGVPYPRTVRDESVYKLEGRRFGYNAYREPGYGMRLFADKQAREKIFNKLFPTPFIGAINIHLTASPKLYPFATCAAVPFPLTSGDDGNPTVADNRCSGGLTLPDTR